VGKSKVEGSGEPVLVGKSKVEGSGEPVLVGRPKAEGCRSPAPILQLKAIRPGLRKAVCVGSAVLMSVLNLTSTFNVL